MSKKIDFTIKKAPYNPRKMSKQARQALKKSIDSFSDLSGITINSKTGNVLAGNHRWEELSKEHGKLELQHIFEDRYAIMGGKKFTGFIARVVSWSLLKEKEANIVANSTLISGEFDENLQPLLQEIQAEEDPEFLEDLLLSEMIIDLDDSDADLDLDDDDKREKTVKSEEAKSRLRDDTPTHSEVRHTFLTIKISTPAEYQEDIMDTVIEALHEKPYYDKVSIS